METIEVIDTKIAAKDNAPPTIIKEQQQPTTSKTQLKQNQHSIEVSSSKKMTEKDMDIKEIYKEIKARNEETKTKIYSQYLKPTLGNQNRRLSTFDYKNKKMHMTFLQPTVQNPKSSSNHK